MTTYNTALKPIQIDNLIKETVNTSMGGNEGIAIVKLRKAFPDAPHMAALNTRLIEIELKARLEMEAAINEFIIPCPVS